MTIRAFGNLTNRIMENYKSKEPAVGMGATLMCYSDRHAYTIVRVDPKGKKLWATRDIVARTDKNGMSESQDYDYTTNPEAHEEFFSLRKDGRWHKGKSMKGLVLSIGDRDEYHDFSF